MKREAEELREKEGEAEKTKEEVKDPRINVGKVGKVRDEIDNQTVDVLRSQMNA